MTYETETHVYTLSHEYICMQAHSSNLCYDYDLHEVWLITLKVLLRSNSH